MVIFFLLYLPPSLSTHDHSTALQISPQLGLGHQDHPLLPSPCSGHQEPSSPPLSEVVAPKEIWGVRLMYSSLPSPPDHTDCTAVSLTLKGGWEKAKNQQPPKRQNKALENILPPSLPAGAWGRPLGSGCSRIPWLSLLEEKGLQKQRSSSCTLHVWAWCWLQNPSTQISLE